MGARRPGLTLVELLVVVVILVSLVAVTLPMMRPALEGREMREAARQLNAYLSGAQARAIARGHSVGVILHRQSNNQGASFQMSLAEVPPPYAGDTVNARAFLNGVGANPWQAMLSDSWTAPSLVTPGDFITFDYRATRYVIQNITPGNDPVITFDHRSASPPPLMPQVDADGYPHVGLPFQIVRKPLRTAAAPLELPAPAVVDIQNMGMGANGEGSSQFIDPSLATDAVADVPITIMFGPSGQVERIYTLGTSGVPLAPIYLLIGRLDQLGLPNLQDPRSLWVSIGHRTGLVTTSPNNGGPAIAGLADVAVARQFALRAQSIGGR